MRHVDGSQGEGGGQILRTSLSLSMVTGEAFQMDLIRAGRTKPGLLRQHLAAVKAAAALCAAEVEGAELGSQTLRFRPGPVRPGAYHAAVGSAGSATLVFQTLLPALLTASGPSTLVLEGGTHNPLAPPFEFLVKTFLPQLAKLGPRVELTLERPGFFPAGGGRFTARIAPTRKLGRLELMERGAPTQVRGRAIVARLSKRIAEREGTVLRQMLKLDGDQVAVEEWVDGPGPGNIVFVEVRSPQVAEVFTAFGERGVSAEKVAETVAREAQAYLGSDVPVGECLADQLLLPLALGAGGVFRTGTLSQHARTQMRVLRDWLGTTIDLHEEAAGAVRLDVKGLG